MDLSQSMRRNSFSSQQNIANDVIADIYVASDVADEFASFTTADMSLAKAMTTGLGDDDTLAKKPLGGGVKKRHAKTTGKRSYSVDAIKFQYPQQQPPIQSSSKDNQLKSEILNAAELSSSAVAASPSSSQSPAHFSQRQRSQSAQFFAGHLCAIDKLSSSSFFSTLERREDDTLAEDLEDCTLIDSMIAEYKFPLEDYNNNGDDAPTSHHFSDDDDEEDTNYQDLLEDTGDPLLECSLNPAEDNDAGPDTTDDITQASSFDDDCYVIDNPYPLRNE